MLPSSTTAISTSAAAQATCWSCALGDSELREDDDRKRRHRLPRVGGDHGADEDRAGEEQRGRLARRPRDAQRWWPSRSRQRRWAGSPSGPCASVEAPSAMLPSRSVDGTSSSTSSVARAIKGSMMIARPSARGESALAAADHDQTEDEHADHDGGHAGQHVQREPDRLGNLRRRELGVEDRKQHADRQRHRRGDQDDDHRADDRVCDAAAGFAERRRVLGEEVEVQGRQALLRPPRSARSRARPPRAAQRRSPGLP